MGRFMKILMISGYRFFFRFGFTMELGTWIWIEGKGLNLVLIPLNRQHTTKMNPLAKPKEESRRNTTTQSQPLSMDRICLAFFLRFSHLLGPHLPHDTKAKCCKAVHLEPFLALGVVDPDPPLPRHSGYPAKAVQAIHTLDAAVPLRSAEQR